MRSAGARSERIEVRCTPRQKDLLQRAAAAVVRSVTELLLDAGLRAAEETLVDRRLLALDEERRRAFEEALERPVRQKPRLAALLGSKSVLE